MIRPYTNKDEEPLLGLIDLNIPTYFAATEKQDYLQYLRTEREDYYVTELNGKPVAAGGINYFPEQSEARISWDVVHPELQGRGIGSDLVRHRLEYIRNQHPKITRVIVRTSQMVYKFYKKQGFRLLRSEPDFWAEGYDLYVMEVSL
ncbi:MAG: GNAT family N-acetyltransferase [Cyclobacteriaceae bacterium]